MNSNENSYLIGYINKDVKIYLPYSKFSKVTNFLSPQDEIYKSIEDFIAPWEDINQVIWISKYNIREPYMKKLVILY